MIFASVWLLLYPFCAHQGGAMRRAAGQLTKKRDRQNTAHTHNTPNTTGQGVRHGAFRTPLLLHGCFLPFLKDLKSVLCFVCFLYADYVIELVQLLRLFCCFSLIPPEGFLRRAPLLHAKTKARVYHMMCKITGNYFPLLASSGIVRFFSVPSHPIPSYYLTSYHIPFHHITSYHTPSYHTLYI